jgi:hypothetical protein
MTEVDESLIRTVRLAIYGAIEATGRAPAAADLALARGLAIVAVEDGYRALADRHVIVLQQDTTDIRWAPPFSLVPTRFRARGPVVMVRALCLGRVRDPRRARL